jgi:hypothetical protein
MLYHLRIFDGVADTVLREYGSLPGGSSHGLLRAHHLQSGLERWLAATQPLLSGSISGCVDQFLDAEFDHATPGARGLGRMTDELPRLAALHRKRLRDADPEDMGCLRELVRDHILCGYLLARFAARLSGEDLRDADDVFYRRWISLIYSQAGASAITGALGDAPQGRDRPIWEVATARRVLYRMRTLGIEPSTRERLILTKYFESGVLLALLEAGRIGDDEQPQPGILFRYGDKPVSKLYVTVNGLLMAYVALTFYHNTLVPLLS